jgi:hypothetical protein
MFEEFETNLWADVCPAWRENDGEDSCREDPLSGVIKDAGRGGFAPGPGRLRTGRAGAGVFVQLVLLKGEAPDLARGAWWETG